MGDASFRTPRLVSQFKHDLSGPAADEANHISNWCAVDAKKENTYARVVKKRGTNPKATGKNEKGKDFGGGDRNLKGRGELILYRRRSDQRGCFAAWLKALSTRKGE